MVVRAGRTRSCGAEQTSGAGRNDERTGVEGRDDGRSHSTIRAHKLEDVRFEFDADDYLKPWKVHSSDGRLEMLFEPTVNRAGRFNLLLIESDQNQVFGYYSGRAVLNDGLVL